jgi:hypothetical protein
VTPKDLSFCSAKIDTPFPSSYKCADQLFYNDSTGLTGSGSDDYDAIGFGTDDGGTSYYYFANGSFQKSGKYFGVGIPEQSLTVTEIGSGVPEPTTWALFLFGFGLVGAALRYRRKSLIINSNKPY